MSLLNNYDANYIVFFMTIFVSSIFETPCIYIFIIHYYNVQRIIAFLYCQFVLVVNFTLNSRATSIPLTICAITSSTADRLCSKKLYSCSLHPSTVLHHRHLLQTICYNQLRLLLHLPISRKEKNKQ